MLETCAPPEIVTVSSADLADCAEYIIDQLVKGTSPNDLVWDLRPIFGGVQWGGMVFAEFRFLRLCGVAANAKHQRGQSNDDACRDLLSVWIDNAVTHFDRAGIAHPDALRRWLAKRPEPWWIVLDVAPTASKEEINHAWRAAAAKAHPDKATGSRAAWDRLERAKAAVRRERAA